MNTEDFNADGSCRHCNAPRDKIHAPFCITQQPRAIQPGPLTKAFDRIFNEIGVATGDSKECPACFAPAGKPHVPGCCHFAMVSAVPSTSPLNIQVAGDHYKSLAIQPAEYIHANSIGWFEGNVIKYVTRWREKGGFKDLEKAKHFIDLLIELEGRKK